MAAKPIKASIIADDESYGRVEYDTCRYAELQSVHGSSDVFLEKLHQTLMTMLAGSLAQNIYRISIGLNKSDEFGDEADASFLVSLFDIDEEKERLLLSKAEKEARELIVQYWRAVECIATELLVWRELSGDDLAAILAEDRLIPQQSTSANSELINDGTSAS